jgi:hypothetical protein
MYVRMITGLIVVLLVIISCEGSSSAPKPLQVSLGTDKQQYEVGEEIRFTATYTNNTTLPMTVTHEIVGGGLMMFSMGETITPGGSISPNLNINPIAASKPGTFSMTLTVTTDGTSPISATDTLSVTVK